MKQADLVVCCYNEEAVIDLFLAEVRQVIDSLPDWQFRLVMVNDGSRDHTLEHLLAARERDERIHILDLSRNFGHEAALAAGLEASQGDVVIVMDADLEDPPALIPRLLAKHAEGYDVVNAHRASRKEDSLLKRLTARGFYQVINAISGKVRIPENVGNYRLVSRRVLDILNQLPERNRVFRVLVPYLGFPTASVDYARPKRPAGQTHYNWSSMMRLAVDGITSATIIPLKLAINTGIFVSVLGFGYMIFVMIQALFTRSTVEGWASTMSVILFLGGIQLIFLGVIGEYVGRIFLEVKRRPDHIVARTWPDARDARPGAATEGPPPGHLPG